MNEIERKQVLEDIRDPTRDEWPAEVRELPTDKMRRFVIEYIANRNGAAAARAADYCSDNPTAEALAKYAYKLLCRDDVVAAIGALGKRQVRSLVPEAVEAIRSSLKEPFGPNKLKAAAMVLDRTDAVVQRVEGKFEHTHKLDVTQVTLEELARLKRQGLTAEAIMAALDFRSQFEMEHYEKLLAKNAVPILEGDFKELPAPDADPDFNADGSLKGE